MIEINLLPEGLRGATKKARDSLKQNKILFYVVLSFALLLAVHIILLAGLIIANLKLQALNNKWKKLEPQRKIADNAKKEFDGLSQEGIILKQIAGSSRNWSEKLNKLSLDLPRGIWFNELSVTQKDFTLKGSVVSLQKEEMSLINKFMDNLRSDSLFFKDFDRLELSSVEKKVIGGYEVADFVLIGVYKSK
jgi:Tfp pilus assembly protein PilN